MSLSSFLQTVKWFQVFLYNSYNLTSVISLHTVYSIWLINRTWSGATILGQSGPRRNVNEGILHKLQSWSLTIGLFNVICKNVVSVFYSPSRLGWQILGNCTSCKIQSRSSPWPTICTPHKVVSHVWCLWCSRYRREKWTRRHEFKSWTRLIAFHIALIPLGKVWIQLFSLQLWVNSRTD